MRVSPPGKGRNQVSMKKMNTVVNPHITFYQDAAAVKGKNIESLNVYKYSNLNPYSTIDNKYKAEQPPQTGDANQVSLNIGMQSALKT